MLPSIVQHAFMQDLVDSNIPHKRTSDVVFKLVDHKHNPLSALERQRSVSGKWLG